jgi:hypothetical protein
MKTVECGFYGNANRLTGDGPTISVNIGFDTNWRPERGHAPIPGEREILALIDTGATECFIDSDLATILNLPIVDRRDVAGSVGKHSVYVFLAQIYIPSLEHVQDGTFAGAYLGRGGMPYRVLLGRTFLQQFVLMYNGITGRVSLSR